MKRFIFLLTILAFGQNMFAQKSFDIKDNKLILPAPVVFKAETDVLLPESDVALKHVVDYLNSMTYITLMRIEGHVAEQGDEAKNLELTKKRAVAICKWLINKGIDCKRLLPVGFGSSMPIESNDTAEGRSANNRCDFANVKLRNILIGGMPADGGGEIADDPCN